MSADIEVEVVGSADGARAFWQGFASIAADVLDEGDLPSEDREPEETAAA
jgi:hypothetical protein